VKIVRMPATAVKKPMKRPMQRPMKASKKQRPRQTPLEKAPNRKKVSAGGRSARSKRAEAGRSVGSRAAEASKRRREVSAQQREKKDKRFLRNQKYRRRDASGSRRTYTPSAKSVARLNLLAGVARRAEAKADRAQATADQGIEATDELRRDHIRFDARLQTLEDVMDVGEVPWPTSDGSTRVGEAGKGVPWPPRRASPCQKDRMMDRLPYSEDVNDMGGQK